MGNDIGTLSSSVRSGRLTEKESTDEALRSAASPRAFKVTALKNHLEINCEMHIVDLEG
jgi:hypothetical protein